MRRGLDDSLARRLKARGYTVGRLKQASDADLAALGLDQAQVEAVRAGARAAVPSDTLAEVLWVNRWTCCVCRRPGLSIVVHHIRPWASSHDHSAENLAVVCTEHHARAHVRGDLEQNLTPQRLRDAKARWETAVRALDVQAILEAAQERGHHWLWFNHTRLLDAAQHLDVPLTQLPHFLSAFSQDLVDARGHPQPIDPSRAFIASGGDGTYLYWYMKDLLEVILAAPAVFNISDELDRGFLARVVRPGDLILVQGRHVFKELTRRTHGPGQAMEVRRQANGVRVSFTIDRWEAVATSAWGSWLRGVQTVASIVRVMDLIRDGDVLEFRCTGLAVGLALQGLQTRSYHHPTWPEPIEAYEGSEDWLEDLLDSDEPA